MFVESDQVEVEESDHEGMSQCEFPEIMAEVPEDMFEPIFLDSPTTVCGAYFSIMHFVSQNKLTYTATSHLLDLLQLLCPSPNKLPTSFYKFKKFFQQFGSVYEKNDYCVNCDTVFEEQAPSTERCCLSVKLGQLVHIPLKKSLQAVVYSKQEHHSHYGFYYNMSNSNI